VVSLAKDKAVMAQETVSTVAHSTIDRASAEAGALRSKAAEGVTAARAAVLTRTDQGRAMAVAAVATLKARGAALAALPAEAVQTVVQGFKASAAAVAALPAEALTAILAAKSRAYSSAEAMRNLLANTYTDVCTKGAKAYLLALASDAKVGTRNALAIAHEKSIAARKEAVERASKAALDAKATALGAAAAARSAAADKKFQVSAASAASGAVALGASGGATGLAAGGVFGAALGVVPAVFTFGLSIPVGAALGSGSGFIVGTLVGGTCGAVGGGAAGYGAYAKRTEISQYAGCVSDKATGAARALQERSTAAFGQATKCAEEVKAQAYASADYRWRSPRQRGRSWWAAVARAAPVESTHLYKECMHDQSCIKWLLKTGLFPRAAAGGCSGFRGTCGPAPRCTGCPEASG
jgi:hypothetical protein